MSIIQNILSDKNELNDRIFNRPTSAIVINGRRINYFNFISSRDNEDCNRALKYIFPKIDIDRIEKIIDDISVINDIQKQFYKEIIKQRYERILQYSYSKLLDEEEEECEETDELER